MSRDDAPLQDQDRDTPIETLQARIAGLEAQLATVQTENQTLRIELGKYYSLYEFAGDSIFLVDAATGFILDANPDAARRLGYSLEELRRCTVFDLEIEKPSKARGSDHSWHSATSGTYIYECQYRCKDGTLLPVEVSSRVVRVAGQDVIQNVVRNIARRKRLEARLRMFERAVEQSANTILITDTAGRIEYVNPKFIALTGYSREEVLGRNPRILKSGQTDPAVYRDLWETIALGGQWTGEFLNRKRNGDLYWEQAAISAVRDEDGETTHFLAVKEDITARKTAETERDRLIAELDAYAHTVAHDLKNPLAALIGYAEVISTMAEQSSPDDLQTMLHQMALTSRKMNSIVDELLLLASVRRLDEVRCEPIQMEPVLVNALHRLEAMREEYAAEIVFPAVEAWPLATGYAPWVEEVWVNYISNAFKYGGRPPCISFGAEVRGDAVWFWVRDNGQGIAPENLNKLFQSFTRLEPARVEGYGLGLSIVQRIVSRLGGEVTVESMPGQGSIFGFTLPVAR